MNPIYKADFWQCLDVFSVWADKIDFQSFASVEAPWDTSLEYPQDILFFSLIKGVEQKVLRIWIYMEILMVHNQNRNFHFFWHDLVFTLPPPPLPWLICFSVCPPNRLIKYYGIDLAYKVSHIVSEANNPASVAYKPSLQDVAEFDAERQFFAT